MLRALQYEIIWETFQFLITHDSHKNKNIWHLHYEGQEFKIIYWYLILNRTQIRTADKYWERHDHSYLNRQDNKIYINNKRLAKLSCKLRFIKCIKIAYPNNISPKQHSRITLLLKCCILILLCKGSRLNFI